MNDLKTYYVWVDGFDQPITVQAHYFTVEEGRLCFKNASNTLYTTDETGYLFNSWTYVEVRGG